MDELSQLLPPLEREAYEALRASIARNGVRLPVVASAGPACAGELADGVHRLRACAELGLECPRVPRRLRHRVLRPAAGVCGTAARVRAGAGGRP